MQQEVSKGEVGKQQHAGSLFFDGADLDVPPSDIEEWSDSGFNHFL